MLKPSGVLILASTMLLAAVALPSVAQTGSLRVTVVDENRMRLPGATVTLTNSQALIVLTASLTDKTGVAAFPVVQAGAGYMLETSLAGYATARRGDLRVATGGKTNVEVVLLSSVSERIKVKAQTPVVDFDQVGSSTKFTDEFLESLPQRGRQYQDVLPRAPGVVDTDGDGNPNVHGARARDFRAEIGGISNVDPLTGQWLSSINLDSIEELEVLPTGAGVEFGRAQGGFARILQKRGSNDFEGVFGFLFRSSTLDGDGAGHVEGPVPAFETVQPSLLLAGPIVKDRLWFRLSHEYIHREDPVNTFGNLGVTTRVQRIAADQLTWQVSPRNRLTFQYQRDPLRVENQGISSRVPPESSQTFERGGSSSSFGWTAPISARVLIDGTVAYQDHVHDLFPTTHDLRQGCVRFVNIPSLNFARCEDVVLNTVSGSHNETSLDVRQRLTVRTQATIHETIAGQGHQFKVGFLVENERYRRQLDRAPIIEREGFGFASDPFTSSELISSVTLRIWNPRESTARATGNSWALYAEDQWALRSNLNVTLGLRFDREEIDAPGWQMDDPRVEAARFFEQLEAGVSLQETTRTVFTGYEDPVGYAGDVARALGIPLSVVRLSPELVQSGFWLKTRRPDGIHLTNNNLSPRLSVAWSPRSDGKTKVALSVGRYYDKTFLAVPMVEVEPFEMRNSFVAAANTDPAAGLDFFTNLFSVTVSPLTARLLDRELSTPYQDELSLSVEREIFAETSIRGGYIRRRFRDQFQDIDINHRAGDYGRCSTEVVDDPDIGALLQGTVVPSPGTGSVQTLPDGETHVDTDAGPGDGLVDDCLGDLRLHDANGHLLDPAQNLPDGRPDLYVENPAWEELLLVGNFNRSDYEAVVIELVRRLYHGWQLQASYTWSRAEGEAEDFNLLLGNEATLREDETGYLDYDRRHVFKLDATGQVGAFRLGGAVTWQSGLPYSLLSPQTVGFNVPPPYPFGRVTALRERLRYPSGRRNDRRNESWFNLDLRVAREFRLGRSRSFQLAVEVFNALNDGTLEIDSVTTDRYRAAFADDVRAPDEIAGTRRFGRRWQLGLRLAF